MTVDGPPGMHGLAVLTPVVTVMAQGIKQEQGM